MSSELRDARDGLTRLERLILWQLDRAQRERGLYDDGTTKSVSTAMLYGRVSEYIDVSVAEFQAALVRLVGRGVPQR